MKKVQSVLLILLLMVFTGCGGGDDPQFIPPLSAQKAITAYSINGADATIDEVEKTIAVILPLGTDVTDLVATFTTTGTSVRVGATLQESAVTANDFTQPVTYTVTAANSSTQDYVVTVTLSNDYTSANIGTLKYVPPGSFQRDATAGNISVISTAFRMSQHEITRAQFLDIMGDDPSDETYSTGDNDPVQTVNWYHVIAFCNKLSLLEGFTPVYSVTGVNFSTLTYAEIPTNWNETWNAVTANWSANGYRLPTEMEWMWAAMGATSASGYTAPTYLTGYAKPFAGSTGSNVIGDYAWILANSGPTTHPAGTKLPNELGLYDMSGNVWEWCWDWYGGYPAGEETDYRGAASGVYRVLRGGSWHDHAANATVAYRYYVLPAYQGGDLGFRVVRP